MFYRQKILLALLEEFGGELQSTDLQKYLFLFTTLCEKEKSYDFVPYKYGCFSLQSYADKRKLIELGHLEDDDHWKLKPTRRSYRKTLKNGEPEKLKLFREKYSKLKGKKLIQHIYRNYPYYAINSVIAEDLLNEEELNAVKAYGKKQEKPVFATIGYEGRSIEGYLNELIKHSIRVLVDVRKNPLSRKYGFSKSALSESLTTLGIKYVHLPELGIVSGKRKKLVTESDYKNLLNEYEKTVLTENTEALEKLYDLYEREKRVAITCFEDHHTMCHRGRVAKHIEKISKSELTILNI